MVDKQNIYQKLVEVRKVLGKVNKDAKGYGFEYVSGAQILGKIEDKMNELGIILESNIIGGSGSVREVKSVNIHGKSIINYVVTADMKMVWIDAENPKDRSVVNWFMVGEQKDPSQALGSGLTYSERYFILKYFNVSTDDDDPDKNKKAGKQSEEVISKGTSVPDRTIVKLNLDTQLKRDLMEKHNDNKELAEAEYIAIKFEEQEMEERE